MRKVYLTVKRAAFPFIFSTACNGSSPKTVFEVENATDTDIYADIEIDTDTNNNKNNDTNTDNNVNHDIDADSDTDSGVDNDTGFDSDSYTDTDSDTDTDTDSNRDSDSSLNSDWDCNETDPSTCDYFLCSLQETSDMAVAKCESLERYDCNAYEACYSNQMECLEEICPVGSYSDLENEPAKSEITQCYSELALCRSDAIMTNEK